MTGRTTIEWTAQPGFRGAVWNPSVGCSRVSAGCDNCYAFSLHDKRYKANLDFARLHVSTTAMLDQHRYLESWMQVADTLPFKGSEWMAEARRLNYRMPFPVQYDRPFSTVQLLDEARLSAPLRVRAPTCYFVDSMSDLFHEDVPDEFIDRVWGAMSASYALGRDARPGHRFLILTKRPERMRAYLTDDRRDRVAQQAAALGGEHDPEGVYEAARRGWGSYPHIWVGTSVENQRSADERIPHLLATPAAVRFLSCEPLLGSVDLTAGPAGDYLGANPDHQAWAIESEHANDHSCLSEDRHANCPVAVQVPTPRLDWVIVGGESGPRARPMDLAWSRSLIAQCRAAGVAVFVKQLGSKPVYEQHQRAASFDIAETVPIKLRESHGRDPEEWPEDLRIREFPR